MLDTLLYLRHETDVWLEITTLLIPGRNDSDAEIAAECQWIRKNLGPDVPVHFTAFHPDYKMLDRPPTPPATLTRARRVGLREGLRFVYGNVHDAEGGNAVSQVRIGGCGSRLVCDAPLRSDRRRLLPGVRLSVARCLRRRPGRTLGRRRLPLVTKPVLGVN